MCKRGPKKAKPIQTTELCKFGCGNVAKFKNSSGVMCSASASSCVANKLKNSAAIKIAHQAGKLPGWSKSNRAWAAGLTKETDSRVKKQADTKKGIRKTTNEEKLGRILYREQCSFRLAGIIERIEGFDLLKTHGMYSRTTNEHGVVRDHIISIDFGFKNKIDPAIISHPANCRFITHKDNARKSKRCDLTLEELIEKIKIWDCEGNRHT